MVKKSHETQLDLMKYGLFVLVISFAYCSLFIYQGIDMTDAGFQLTHQYLTYNLGLEYSFPPAWFSDYVGGFLLALVEKCGLFGSRIIWALGVSITAYISYLILSELFSAKLSAFTVLLVVPVSCFTGQMVFNYYYFPMLLYIASIWALLKLFTSHELENKNIYVINCALLLFLCFISRGTFVLAMSTPLLVWCLYKYFDYKNTIDFKIIISIYVLIFIQILILVIYLSVYEQDFIQHFYKSVSEILNNRKEQTFSGIPRHLLFSLRIIPEIIMTYLLILILNGLLSGNVRHSELLIYGITLILFFNIFINEKRFWLAAYSAIYFCFILNFVVYVVSNDKKNINLHILILSLLAITPPIMIVIGSGSILWKMYYGFWLLMPLVPLLVLKTSNYPLFFKNTLRINQKNLFIINLAIVTAVSVYFIYYRVTNPMLRDTHNRVDMIYEIKDESTRNIYTTKERAISLSELLKVIKENTSDGDKIFAYNSIPILYYLSNTLPLFKRHWLIIDNISLEEITNISELICTNEFFPKLIVKSLINTRDREWGLKPTSALITRFNPKLEKLDEGIAKCNYKEIWQNNDFLVYVPDNLY